MDKFIAVFLGGLILVAAAHAESFSNEDSACTGPCRMHDGAVAVATDKAVAPGKRPGKLGTAARAAK